MLGDIHRRQFLDEQGRIWYAGSTVQQNHGETNDKGILIWDIDSKYVKVGAARLIELIKKDLIEDKNINIYDKHALVLTTNSKISQDSILDYANQIKSKVLEVFNISLEIEPTIIPQQPQERSVWTKDEGSWLWGWGPKK